jgi:hypothetical protein
VIEELAATGSDEALGVAVLPRRPRCDLQLLDADVVDAGVEDRPVDPIAVTDEASRHELGPDRLDDLLRGLRRVRLPRHVDVEHAAPLEREDEEDVNDAERHGGQACAQVDMNAIAGEVVAGEHLARPPKAPFDVDDDVRGR